MFKRPPIFKEITTAYDILTCTRVANYDSSGISNLQISQNPPERLDNLLSRRDMYYGKFDRLFMAFQDLSHFKGNLSSFSRIYLAEDKKLKLDILTEIDRKITASRYLDYRVYQHNLSGALFGFVLEFNSIDSVKFLYAGLQGGEVSNDHFPFDEFLFKDFSGEYKLIDKQRFYTDVAGIEVIEVGKFGPFGSLILSIVFAISILVIKLFETKSYSISAL